MKNASQDGFWRIFSVILMVAVIALSIANYTSRPKYNYTFHESAKAQPRTELASINKSSSLDHESVYWIADLAQQSLPYVVSIKTAIDPDKLDESEGNGGREMMDRFKHLTPQGFNLPDEFEMPEDHPIPGGEGSGFIIREDGYIVTNAHVVEDANEFTVYLGEDTTKDGLPATLVGKDNYKDIAVLKVDATGLPAAVLGKSGESRVGEPVVAIGSPLGHAATVTAGILSSNTRKLEEVGRSYDIRKPQIYLQTDAAINRGNSGGPLFNAQGEVIGVNQAIARWDYTETGRIPIEGIGFAIPIDEVKDTISQIMEKGKAVYPGISANITSVEEFLHFNPNQELAVDAGVYISGIVKGGPADKAGLAAGDVITEFNGEPVSDANQLITMISEHEVGERVKLTVSRNGTERYEEVIVVLGELDLDNVRAGD
ncbi:MAG: trypsin-like peptidase domain-containing protein [Planctomycetales bacterium]|nr:trypsin-like peptidase domain-containing protein [bacterium]UNM08416.1 MAG: trypsin-like peptidase domain-containing protein [Planctomycetales bacterium]